MHKKMSLANHARLFCRCRGRGLSLVQVQRRMASTRNTTVEGGSNPTNITEEVRDLIRNARQMENIEEWRRGATMDEKITVKTFR